MRSNLATLTMKESKAWDKYFAYYVDEEGLGDTEAAEKTWADLQNEFPRLRGYDGAKA